MDAPYSYTSLCTTLLDYCIPAHLILQKTAWLALTWIPRGIPKAVANEVAAIGQAFAHPEALARVAQLVAYVVSRSYVVSLSVFLRYSLSARTTFEVSRASLKSL